MEIQFYTKNTTHVNEAIKDIPKTVFVKFGEIISSY